MQRLGQSHTANLWQNQDWNPGPPWNLPSREQGKDGSWESLRGNTSWPLVRTPGSPRMLMLPNWSAGYKHSPTKDLLTVSPGPEFARFLLVLVFCLQDTLQCNEELVYFTFCAS